jgi:hypothetical protein
VLVALLMSLGLTVTGPGAEATAGGFTPLSPTRALDSRYSSPFAPGETRRVKLPSIPSNATAAALNVTVLAGDVAGYVTVWAAGSPQPPTSNVNVDPYWTAANLVLTGVTDRTVNVRNAAGTTHILVDVVGYDTGDFTAITPVRVLDTRSRTGLPFGHVESGQVIDVDVRTLADLPAEAVAVAVNLTAVGYRQPSFVTASPTGGPLPGTSNVNVTAGRTVANLALVGLAADGHISLRNGPGGIDLIADVLGWSDGSSYHPLAGEQIIDTRQHTCGFVLTAGEERRLTVTGTGGLPVSGVAAVAINLTAVDPTAGGYLSVYPAGTPVPPSSTLNFAAGTTVGNAAIVGVGSGGQIAVYNPAGTVHVLVGVAGYHTGDPIGSGPAITCPTTDERPQPPPLPEGVVCPERASGTSGDYAVILATAGTTTCEAALRVADELLAAPGLLFIDGWNCVFDGAPPPAYFAAECSRGNDYFLLGEAPNRYVRFHPMLGAVARAFVTGLFNGTDPRPFIAERFADITYTRHPDPARNRQLLDQAYDQGRPGLTLVRTGPRPPGNLREPGCSFPADVTTVCTVIAEFATGPARTVTVAMQGFTQDDTKVVVGWTIA